MAPSASEAGELVGCLRTWSARAIAGLMLWCGLRSCEVLGLDVKDVDIGGRWVTVTGKGNKQRRVPLDADVASVIDVYLLAERPASDCDRLFLVAKGPHRGQAVSYTHLTLPTSDLVEISVGAVSFKKKKSTGPTHGRGYRTH